ncbi:protein rep, partial [Enterococcus faecium]|nr:protein rep [Enterococcus faecium]
SSFLLLSFSIILPYLIVDLKLCNRTKNLEYALAGTRQISYGGLLKQIKQDLKLEDVENGDLVHVGDEDYTKEQMEAAEEVVAKWDFNKQNYFIW